MIDVFVVVESSRNSHSTLGECHRTLTRPLCDMWWPRDVAPSGLRPSGATSLGHHISHSGRGRVLWHSPRVEWEFPLNSPLWVPLVWMAFFTLVYSPKESSLKNSPRVPLVECSHYLVLLVGKIFHPEEACFFFFIVRVGGGGGGGRITFLHFWPCWDHFFQISRVVRCLA